MILAGNTHPGDGILACAAAQAVCTVEAHVLLLFLGEEDVRQVGSVFVLSVILAHLLVDLVRRVEPLLTQMVRKRTRERPFADLIGGLQKKSIRALTVGEQQES